MKLFVIGATGRTGGEVVQQALARGHMVTAFVAFTRRDSLEERRAEDREGRRDGRRGAFSGNAKSGRGCFSSRSAKGLQTGLNSSRQRPCDHARNASRWNKTARCSFGGGPFSRYSKPDRELYPARTHARFAGNGGNRQKQQPRMDDCSAAAPHSGKLSDLSKPGRCSSQEGFLARPQSDGCIHARRYRAKETFSENCGRRKVICEVHMALTRTCAMRIIITMLTLFVAPTAVDGYKSPAKDFGSVRPNLKYLVKVAYSAEKDTGTTRVRFLTRVLF